MSMQAGAVRLAIYPLVIEKCIARMIVALTSMPYIYIRIERMSIFAI